jgi:hypothetical protein
LGSGGTTKFWLDKWVGSAPLCNIFLWLFLVSLQPGLIIKELGVWKGDNWYWRLGEEDSLVGRKNCIDILSRSLMRLQSQRSRTRGFVVLQVCTL